MMSEPSPSSPYFDYEERQGALIIRVKGPEIRHPEPASGLGTDVLELASQLGAKRLVLDLSDVKYLSSTGFAVLLRVGQQLERDGGKVAACGLANAVEVGANIIGLGRIISIHPDVRSALKTI